MVDMTSRSCINSFQITEWYSQRQPSVYQPNITASSTKKKQHKNCTTIGNTALQHHTSPTKPISTYGISNASRSASFPRFLGCADAFPFFLPVVFFSFFDPDPRSLFLPNSRAESRCNDRAPLPVSLLPRQISVSNSAALMSLASKSTHLEPPVTIVFPASNFFPNSPLSPLA